MRQRMDDGHSLDEIYCRTKYKIKDGMLVLRQRTRSVVSRRETTYLSATRPHSSPTPLQFTLGLVSLLAK